MSLSPKGPRDRVVATRLSTSEAEALDGYARRAGLTASAVVRQTLAASGVTTPVTPPRWSLTASSETES